MISMKSGAIIRDGDRKRAPFLVLGLAPEEVGHSSKSIMVGRISESRTLFYRGHEIDMAGFQEEVSINIDSFYLLFLALRFKTDRKSWS